MNPSFETPVQMNIGDNLPGTDTITGWTMTGSRFNIIKTNGSPYSGGPDKAQHGIQYVDIAAAAGTLYQDFIITGDTAVRVCFIGYFSSREQNSYVNWTASIDIIDLSTKLVVSTAKTRNFTIADGASPAQENWYELYGNASLPPGNYRYQANMGKYGNFDNALVVVGCDLVRIGYGTHKQSKMTN